MNKQEIQTRIQTINNEMIQLRANYAKLEGHLGEAQHWLAELLNKEKTSQPSENMESVNDEHACEPVQQTASI